MLLKIIPLSLAPKNNKICNHESEKLAHSNLGNISARFKESAIRGWRCPMFRDWKTLFC